MYSSDVPTGSSTYVSVLFVEDKVCNLSETRRLMCSFSNSNFSYLGSNQSSKDDLDGLSAPVHLNAEPDYGRHDPIEYRPEPTPHTPGTPAHYGEAQVLVRSCPASNDGYDRYE